jgi:hypothetical protein
MNRKLFSLVAIGLFAIIGAGTASAQVEGAVTRATIPFDFSVRGKTLPAGQYEVRETMDGSGTFRIANVKHNRDSVMFETEPVIANEVPNRSELVFDQLDGNYYLAKVFAAGDATGIEAMPSRQERRLERETMGQGVKAESVVVAMN